MTVETLQYISLGCFVLSGVMSAVSVILFIVYRIPVIIGDLSGANARRAIETIRRMQKDDVEEISESGTAEEPFEGANQTTLLHEMHNSIVVEYEIGFWTSREIIEVR